jgi:exodeoxyribonuclease III
MKLYSWNVNGIRSVLQKGFTDFLKEHSPDIVCLQETKIDDSLVHTFSFEGYTSHFYCAIDKGYSGTAILIKNSLCLSTPTKGMHTTTVTEHLSEGRVMCVDCETFYLVTVYTPNSGRGLDRLSYRKEWDSVFLTYIQTLQKQKPVIVCGDLNVAHTDIDLANPKQNYNKTAGYTQVEIDGLTQLLTTAQLLDSYRELHPHSVEYSWWSYMFQARAKNIGWRIDYFLIDARLRSLLQIAQIHTKVLGSDHCPVSVTIKS